MKKPRRSPTSSSLQNRTRQELLALAKQRNIRGRSRMTKAQLIKALTSVPAEASPVSQPSVGGPIRRTSYEDLPETYGATELVLLPVDPYWIHAYWEVTPQTLSDVLSQIGSDAPQARYVLRIYDVTAIQFDGHNAHSSFDLPIELSARNWYIQLWSGEKSLVADLGLLLPDGRFFLLARSNAAHTPREGVSIFTEAPWAEPSALGEHEPARFRFHSQEPRYDPRPVYHATLSKTFWKRLKEESRALTRGQASLSSPGLQWIPGR